VQQVARQQNGLDIRPPRVLMPYGEQQLDETRLIARARLRMLGPGCRIERRAARRLRSATRPDNDGEQ
jgi:hypothetical protein